MSKQQSFGSLLDEIIKEGMEELIKNMMRDTITQEQVEALENNRTTEVIKGLNFSGVTLTSLPGMKFEDCLFKDCCFKEGDFIKAEFKYCNFKNCDFESADFRETNFKDCHFNDSSLRYTIFRKANLCGVNLYECNLFLANFLCAYLERVYFYGGSLECSGFLSSVGKNVGFTNTDLRGTNFSGSNGITMSPIKYLEDNFKKTTKGYIVYKAIGQFYQPNPDWVIKPGKLLKEAVNPDRTVECSCGVNVATYEWVKEACGIIDFDIWECLIKWEWLPGVVVPYNTTGKIRSERVQLLKIVEEE